MATGCHDRRQFAMSLSTHCGHSFRAVAHLDSSGGRMGPVSTRTLIAARRGLIFAAVGIAIVAMLRSDSPLPLFSAMAVILILYTDLCRGCGKVLFFDRGRTWKQRLNPLYVPPACCRCGAET